MYYLLRRQCDQAGYTSAGGTSDDWYGEGWYRFTGKEVQIVHVHMLFLVIDTIYKYLLVKQK